MNTIPKSVPKIIYIKLFMISLAVFLSATISVSAQTSGTDTLRWSVSGFTDLNNTTQVVGASEFVIRGSNSITWVQNNGNFTVNWNILSTTGSWPDMSLNGSQTFSFADDHVQGTLITSRSQEGLSIELSMTGGPSPFHLKFSVINVTKE